ncbi:molybdenum cofactor biosynthesis protein MoaE [Novosphingobium profundi]|uniref:molybdenum cofactor biosynthesis protein MoaE n=1 Tax=Novosphingobium profundi TaxID=1774954 RepID=UPI001BD967AD|nr:molybdenum cofactor biosynthesis protein MoaE [Novosphingobium profundi]MBT0669938.1 molybdenum cofactor biosynthesis protein MoaE [Novosphingobium profundi]
MDTPAQRSDVRLLDAPFDAAATLAGFTSAQAAAGGIVSFLGQVRLDEGVEALELRHYEPLTRPAMEDLAAQVRARWALEGLLIVHRSGEMAPGEPIVLVAAAARHRRDAFAAADFTMDHLKSESWFWKREKVGGTWRWVEPRAQDFTDIARWQAKAPA